MILLYIKVFLINAFHYLKDRRTKHIPYGLYCYSVHNTKHGALLYKCPYWSVDEDMPKQLNGYCSFLGEGDWDQKHISLLWDQCKECDVKDSKDHLILQEHTHLKYYKNQ